MPATNMRDSGTTAGEEQGASNRWLCLGVFPVALWASFLNLLNFNNYPLFAAEVGIVLLGLGGLGVLMALVVRAAQPRLWAPVAGLFTALLVDLNAAIDNAWFFGCWAAFTAFALFAREAFAKILFAASLAVLLFQGAELVSGPDAAAAPVNEAKNLQDPRRAATDRPAIVHVVLDSYLGLDGMALGPEAYRDLRAQQTAFFTGRGFQTYPRAYSRHAKTLNALPALFSYGGAVPPIQTLRADYAIPDQLPYFADLDRRGYRIKAVLPAYFDLCVKQKLTHCRTFQSSALSAMSGTAIGATDRAAVFGFAMLNLVPAARAVADRVRPDPRARLAQNRGKLFSLTSLGEFDRFIADLPELRRGEVRFAHLLLPHDPYMLAADCTLKPAAAWLDEHGPGAVAAREAAYAEQVTCLQTRLARMLDALDRSAAGREAIVLIHGDHGSRIAPSQPFVDGPALSQRELLMAYSTLFAIRVPGEAGGEVGGTHALDELMADFRARDFASAPRPAPAATRVAAIDAYGVPRAWRRLPGFAPQS